MKVGWVKPPKIPKKTININSVLPNIKAIAFLPVSETLNVMLGCASLNPTYKNPGG
jgi:hypothetical protein